MNAHYSHLSVLSVALFLIGTIIERSLYRRLGG
jgi:hypothetical protein